MPTVELKRGSSYRLPISKKIVVQGEPVQINDIEWRKIKDIGRFIEIKEPDPELPGLVLSSADDEPQQRLPDSWEHKKIVIRLVGGVGDCIMATSLARFLKKQPCYVAMAVRKNMVDLVQSFAGVDEAFDAVEMNGSSKRNQFEIELDLQYALTNSTQILDKEYYSAIYDKVGLQHDVVMPKLMLHKDTMEKVRKRLPEKPIVALHAGASNPIRRWSEENWRKLAYKLVERGCSVLWMGQNTADDFSFEDVNIKQAHTISPDLVDQAAMLWHCEYFIGSDSGFAHMAGVMNIPGLVIFSATKPEHVIGRYKSLRPIEVFNEVGVTPSRSIKNTDDDSLKCMRAITVERVIGRTDPRLFDRHKGRQLKPVAKPAPQIVKRVQVNRQTRMLAVLPHMIMGGGERMMSGLLRNLSKWFHVDAVGLHLSYASRREDMMRPVIAKSINGKLHTFDHQQELTDLEGLVKSEDYDVVLYYGWSNEITQVFSKLSVRPAMIRVCHSQGPQEYQAIENGRGTMDRLITVSKAASEKLGGTWIPNGVDTTRFTGQEPADVKFNNDYPTLGYIGRVDLLKGVGRVIEFAKTQKFNFLIVGGDETADSKFVRRAIKEYGIEDRVKLIDAVENVEPYYRCIDAYVLMSESEGMPLGVLEAAYCGIPSISTPVGSLPNIFQDGSTILFCNKKLDSFLDCLKRVQTNAREIGLNAQKLVQEKYTDQVQAEAYRKEIRSVMGGTWPDKVSQGTIRIKRGTGAGDCIMATSVIAKTAEMFPKASIHFQAPVDLLPLVEHHPLVSERYAYESDESKKPVDLEVDCGYYDCWKNGQHAINAMGGNKHEVSLVIPPDIQPPQFEHPTVGFWMYQNPNSIVRTKEWPKERWIELAGRLNAKGIKCAQLGAKFEALVDDKLFLDHRKQSILDSLVCMVSLDLVVCIDCVASHAAYGLGRPAIVLWGGSATPEIIGYSEHENIVTENPERCMASLCVSTYKKPGCCGNASCMNGISVDRVEAAVLRKLNG